MDENIKNTMIELFATRKISSFRIFREIIREHEMTKKEFYIMLKNLEKTREIIRRPSKYKVRCICCKEYIPRLEMLSLYCEKCCFLETYKDKLIQCPEKGVDDYDG